MDRNTQWGYLRETSESAKKTGPHPVTGIRRTGLDEYLKEIFPDVDDWVHDMSIELELNGKPVRSRPDYRSETLKLIVEFDGMPHYQKPDVIRRDELNTERYQRLGYKVIRIPFFVQLTRTAISRLFGVDVGTETFDPSLPSLDETCSPAFLCPAGISRMAKEFRKFPDQYKTNVDALEKINDDFLTGVSLLKAEYEKLQD